MTIFQKAKLGDIYKFQYGKGNTNPSNGGKYPVYGAGSLLGYFDEYNAENSPVIGHMGANCGTVIFGRGKHFVTYNGIMALIKEGSDSRFGYYTLLSKDFRKSIRGSAQPFISYDLLNNVDILLPDFPTQTLIGSVLSAYDDLIENNEKRIKLLEEMAQLLYTEWFAKFKFPGSEKVKLIDSGTEYGKVPEGWEVKKFYDVVYNFDSKRKPISSIKRRDIVGDFPYYGAAKIIDYINGYIFDGKYLLIAEDGSVITPDGKPVLQFVNEKFWVSNHAHAVRGKLLSTEVVYLRLKQFNIKPLITGAAQPKITKDNLSRVLFLVPDKESNQLFTEIFEDYFEKIFNIQRQNKILSQTRDLLIPQLVTGKRELK